MAARIEDPFFDEAYEPQLVVVRSASSWVEVQLMSDAECGRFSGGIIEARSKSGVIQAEVSAMRRFTTFALGAVGVLVLTAPLMAHHRWPVDMSTLVTVQGTVVSFAWQNPHPMIQLDVTTEDGEVERWQVGGPAINRMVANGWSRDTLEGGEVISGIGHQFSDGQRIIRLQRVIFEDGREMLVYARE